MTHEPSRHGVDLLRLLARFKPLDDVENELAWFKTRVPSVGTHAYLNLVYKPVDARLRSRIGAELEFPACLYGFYERYNGARLFMDSLSVYGLMDANEPYNRTPFGLQPFRISQVNLEFCKNLSELEAICIGSYGYDRSLVCLRKSDLSIVCFRGTGFTKVRAQWVAFDDWLSSEVGRLASMHDDSGVIQVDESLTLPEQGLQ